MVTPRVWLRNVFEIEGSHYFVVGYGVKGLNLVNYCMQNEFSGPFVASDGYFRGWKQVGNISNVCIM